MAAKKKHVVQVSTPEHFTKAEHQALQKEFKSKVVGVMRRRKSDDYDPSVENVETTITRRKPRAKKRSTAKKSGKATKK